MKQLIEIGQAGGDGAQSRHLRNRQVDEDDAPPQHVDAQRHMGCEYQQAGDEGGEQQAPIKPLQFGAHFSGTSSRATVSSNSVVRSFACGVPPTLKGRTTTGSLVSADNHSAGRAEL